MILALRPTDSEAPTEALRRPGAPPAAAPRYRGDIEGLRAVAVLAVLLFHAAVPHLAGGFVGVDVFFVISGFVITGLLVTEVTRTGRVSLAEFYARRARRILPSAGVVLLVVAVVSWFVLPPLRLVDVAKDLLAAALQIANWHFVAAQTNYMSAGRDPSPVLHYWSLAVEEQFYLLWPSLLLVAVWIARRLRVPWQACGALLVGAVVVASFLDSLHWTRAEAPTAYLSSPTRAWQFGVGAAVALAAARLSRPAGRTAVAVRFLLGWGGLAAIGYGIVVFAATTPFPGTAALYPTLGTAAVLIAGLGGARRATAGSLLDVRPLRAVGRLSFAWYLWHWAVLVLVEAGTGPLPWPAKLGIVLASALPAWLTMRLVERPIRYSRIVSLHPAQGLSIGAIAVIVPVVATLLAGTSAIRAVGGGDSLVSIGALTVPGADPLAGRAQVRGGRTTPTPSVARGDLPTFAGSCQVDALATVSPRCMFPATPTFGHVVLLGDSHAAQWFGAVEGVARPRGWAVEVLTKSGCPLPRVSVLSAQLGRTYTECDIWRAGVLRRLAQEGRPRAIFLATQNRYASSQSALLSGWQYVLDALRPLHVPLVYLRDTPFPATDVPVCVSGALSDWAHCAFPRANAFRPDALVAALHRRIVSGVLVVDATAVLCPSGPTCPAVRGGVLLYRDDSHITNTVSEILAGVVATALHGQISGI